MDSLFLYIDPKIVDEYINSARLDFREYKNLLNSPIMTKYADDAGYVVFFLLIIIIFYFSVKYKYIYIYN